VLAGLGPAAPALNGPPASAKPVTLIRIAHNGHYCDGCSPPLVYSGGPVADTSGAAGLTITPVYWLPQGAGYTFPSGYAAALNGYASNLAAASGTRDNVLSIATEYYGATAAGKINLRYGIAAGTPIVDTDPFPPAGCELASSDYSTCLTDGQIRAELASVLAANGLPTGLSAFYPVFLPPRVEIADRDGTNSDSTFCGYHHSFGAGAAVTLYSVEPLETSGCDGGQAPNGSVVTDGAISTFSHELMETLTDPVDEDGAWLDRSGDEIGDICSDYYGSPLGSTDPSRPGTTEYNQVINGARYYTQTEFSNQAFAKLGVGNGCQPSAKAAAAGPSTASRIVIDAGAYPASLPADGKSTAVDQVLVDDTHGNAIDGDPISLATYVVDGRGSCGALDRTSGTEKGLYGLLVRYTASTDDVVCGIVATEGKGGKSATALVYQGSYRARAATATDTVPDSLKAGATSFFTMTFGNPSAKPIPFATIELQITSGATRAPDVAAAQIRVATSLHGRVGPFTRLETSGSTVEAAAIQGRVAGPAGTGLVLRPHGKLTVTFRVTLAASVPSRGKAPVLSFEGYLDQLNPATGSGTTLADTLATDIVVLPPSPPHALALASVGSLRSGAHLQFKLWDDSGEAGAQITVARAGRTVDSFDLSTGEAKLGAVYYVTWRAPRGSPAGAYTFCVTPKRGTVVGVRSCASLRLT